MKKIKWFKTGDNIPNNAVYLETVNKIVGSKTEHGISWDDEVPIWEEMHLYEVPIDVYSDNILPVLGKGDK